MKDGQTSGTRKWFSSSKQMLISKKYLFWIYHGKLFSGEVASVFENTDVCGKFVNVPWPSSGIHTFFWSGTGPEFLV